MIRIIQIIIIALFALFSCVNKSTKEVDPQTLVDLGIKYEDSLEYEKALDLYLEALELKTNDSDILSRISNIKYKLGDYESALDFINKSISNGNKGLYSLHLKYNIFYDMGMIDSSIYQLNLILEKDSINIYYAKTVDSKVEFFEINKYDIILEKMTCLFDLGEYYELINTADSYYNNYGDSVQFMVYKINAYLYLGNVDSACLVLSDHPDNEMILYYQVFDLQQDEQYEIGLSLLEKLIEMNPINSDYLFVKGDIYKAKNDTVLQLEYYNRAINMNSSNEVYYYNRGNFFYRKNDFEKAISDYTKGIELNPNYYQCYTNRGLSYMSLGKEDFAKKDLKKAAEFGDELAIEILENN